MARIDDLLREALKGLPPKPADTALQGEKKRYSELMSAAVAQVFAQELRNRGMLESRPSPPGVTGASGAERRLAGGLGAKKVDVSWATDASGLILGITVKTINFRDGQSGAFQKNLTNRRADLLNEAVTLHRRFPYAVLGGFFFIDADAKTDGTARRQSTFLNAFPRFRLFTGRRDPAGRDEQYERLYLVPVRANPFNPTWECFHMTDSHNVVSLDDALTALVDLVVERNFDTYETDGDGGVRRST